MARPWMACRSLRPHRWSDRSDQSGRAQMVLGEGARQHPVAGLRLSMAGRNRTGSGAERLLLLDRFGRPLSQSVPAVARGRRGGKPARLEAKQAGADPVARRVSGFAADGRLVLVLGHPADLGSVDAPGADRFEHDRIRYRLLGNDIGGWQKLAPATSATKTPLVDPSDARDVVGNYHDYPELLTRWFQYGTFLPTLRLHGDRKEADIWSFGKQAITD